MVGSWFRSMTGSNGLPACTAGTSPAGARRRTCIFPASIGRYGTARQPRPIPDELIVAESILDALAIFAAGRKNVIACYGANGWTPHHDELLEKHSVRKIVLALDNDETGERVTRELAQKLDGKGIRCHHIKWPEGIKDANDYFQYHTATGFKGTPETFASLLTAAPRIGFTKGVAGSKLTLAEKTDEHALFENGSVSYRVKSLSSNGALKVILTARKEGIAAR